MPDTRDENGCNETEQITEFSSHSFRVEEAGNGLQRLVFSIETDAGRRTSARTALSVLVSVDDMPEIANKIALSHALARIIREPDDTVPRTAADPH